MNSSGEGQKGRQKKAVNFDEAMTKAFGEIFHNLKEIEADAKRQRKKLDLQTRRQSAPASVLRDVTDRLKEPEKELENESSTIPASSCSTTQWVLECCEEEEEIQQDVGSDDLSRDFLIGLIRKKTKTAFK